MKLDVINNAKITVKNLFKSFGSNKVLDGIDLTVKAGSSLVILGGSGTGKSVLIKNIIGLIKPDSGEIYIDDLDCSKLSNSERFMLMQKCGFLFQGGALFDSLTVSENIVFFAEKLHKLSSSEKYDLAVEKLKAVGLPEHVAGLYPSELSGGMQKRVALARAIATNPEIIFFDEPTTGLDPIMANVINDLIIKITEELGATTITITHDMNSAYLIAKEVALIYHGKILWKGDKEEMKTASNPYIHQFVNGLAAGPMAS